MGFKVRTRTVVTCRPAKPPLINGTHIPSTEIFLVRFGRSFIGWICLLCLLGQGRELLERIIISSQCLWHQSAKKLFDVYLIIIHWTQARTSLGYRSIWSLMRTDRTTPRVRSSVAYRISISVACIGRLHSQTVSLVAQKQISCYTRPPIFKY